MIFFSNDATRVKHYVSSVTKSISYLMQKIFNLASYLNPSECFAHFDIFSLLINTCIFIFIHIKTCQMFFHL